LNPDTELVSPAINVMFDALQQLPNAGVIGSKLLNGNGTIQTSCIQAFPTILNQFLSSEFLRALWPKSALWGMAPLFSAENGSEEVEALSGACIMLKRTLFEHVERFDDDYFMYGEDIDLCHKVKQAGSKNYYVPRATVVHLGGGSAKKAHSDFSIVMMRESVWRFLRKTRGVTYAAGYRSTMLVSAIGRMEVLLILLPVYLARGHWESWKTSVRKWWAVLGWSLGLWNR